MSTEFRILIVDDNEDIHDDYLKALDLYSVSKDKEKLRHLEELLFEPEDLAPDPAEGQTQYRVSSAFQGEEGYAVAMKAAMDGDPFALAFVDVRMPPGMDGIQTTCRLLADVPDLEIVLCSAYSDYPWERINEILGHSDRVLFLRKPFDVIEVKQMAEALSRKWELKQEHRVTTGQLVAAREQAIAASKEKSSFLANMSHEILTPLNGVIDMASLLRHTKLDLEQKSFVEGISQNAQALFDLIHNILDFSKIEVGKILLEEVSFDLHDLIYSMHTLFGHRFAECQLDLVINLEEGLPRFVNGDPIHIRQILVNFLSNALKFTKRGEVTVEVKREHSTKHDLLLKWTVSDTGIGISDSCKDKLSRAFSQTDSSTKDGGSGLGLVISKMLVRLLQGDIGMSSEQGKGSHFWFTCPLKAAKEVLGSGE